ncbi:MAG: MFS transporter [Dehalococcoidia bacterium]|nr:MFS transporter [Dehalococcoidia bacterium]MSQ17038.1 MFS transporter [Dehalococcoidia bacterium]
MLVAARDRFLSALQYRDYRHLWFASVFAGAAAWALIVARGWLAYQITDSSLWVGVVTFMAMAPRAFATPIIGFLADRLDRKTLVSWTYALNLVHNVALALLAMGDMITPWNLVLLSLINGTLRAAQMPTTQSLVANVVPRKDLPNAVALNEATQQGSRLVGPLAILPLLALVNVAAAFWLCSVFYLAGLVLTLQVRTRSRGVIEPNRGFAHNFFAGFGYVYQTPLLLGIILLTLAHCALSMSYESMLPEISQEKLQAGSVGVSYLMAGVGFGALVTSVFLAGVSNQVVRGRLFLIFALISGLSPGALALSSTKELSVLAAVAMGVTQAGFMTIAHTIIQTIVPDGIRGRVSGVYSFHVGGSMALANLFNGALSDVLGGSMVMAYSGLILVVAAGLSLASASLRSIYFPGAAKPLPMAQGTPGND